MDDLQKICNTILNDADLTLSVDGQKGVIKLEFYPAGHNGVITFFCTDYSRLNFRKSSEDGNAIFVGSVFVSLIDDKDRIAQFYKEDGWARYNTSSINQVVLVEIDGGCMVSIVCEKFSWQKDHGPIQKIL